MSAKSLIEAKKVVREIRLRGGRTIEIASADDVTRLCVRGDADRAVDIEIEWSAQGPIARVRAARIDVDTTADVNLRCETFRVHATKEIDLEARGELRASASAVGLEARDGRVVARANDEVQLLGEQILLNCERSTEIPDWVRQAPGLMFNELVGIAEASGDPELIDTIRGEMSKDDASR
jgi:hypothetical protein